MEFIIGSTNAAKVEAVRNVVIHHFPESVIRESSVPSGVAAQPIGDVETKTGAINRALSAGVMRENCIGIGLEGGVKWIDGELFLCNWGALTMPDGRLFTAGGAQIPIPVEIANEIKEGKELGPVVDQYFSMNGIRQKEGAIGMFTAQLVNRIELFDHIMKLLIGQLKYALAKQ